MQNKKLYHSTIIGIIFTIILGTLLHFLFDFSSHNRIIAFFSPVNESAWEHLKLLFYPFFIYSFYEYNKFVPYYNNFFIAKMIGLLAGLASILILFFTYTGIIGTNYFIVDILIYILGVILAFLVSSKLMRHNSSLPFTDYVISIILAIILLFCFFFFTYYPPKINLFFDSVAKIYSHPSL